MSERDEPEPKFVLLHDEDGWHIGIPELQDKFGPYPSEGRARRVLDFLLRERVSDADGH